MSGFLNLLHLADFRGVRTHLEPTLLQHGVIIQSTLDTIIGGSFLLLHHADVIGVETHMDLALLRQGVNIPSTLHPIVDWVLADFIEVTCTHASGSK